MLGDKLYENLLEWIFRTNEQVGVRFYAIIPEVRAGLSFYAIFTVFERLII